MLVQAQPTTDSERSIWRDRRPRSNVIRVFVDAKAYNCGQSFKIETVGSVGTIFTEQTADRDLGVDYDADETTSLSRGNHLRTVGAPTMLEAWVDNGLGNVFEGYEDFERGSALNKWVHQLSVNKPEDEGTRVLNHTGDGTFDDDVIDGRRGDRELHHRGPGPH